MELVEQGPQQQWSKSGVLSIAILYRGSLLMAISVRVVFIIEIWHDTTTSLRRLVMKNPTLLVLLAAVVSIMVLPVEQSAKFLLIGIAMALYVYMKRGYIYVALGSRILSSQGSDAQKAWDYYRRAWKAGITPQYTVMLGNLFVQRGDPSVALDIYNSVLQKERAKRQPDGEIIVSARISRTMALWTTGEKSSAIDELQELYQEGRRDMSLLINLSTYLLDADRLEEAKALLDDIADEIPASPGLSDNQGLYLLKTGNYEEAEQLYDMLITREQPKFPEAFVHAALAYRETGRLRDAYGMLQEASEKEFFNTATVSKDLIQQLMQEIEHDPQYVLSDDESNELAEVLYDQDLFDDGPNTDVHDDDEIEPNIELDDEDFADEEDPEVVVDPEEFSSVESELFDDDYEDEDERGSKQQ
jgi:tetratricopeptide (TPR) repeat protein